MKYSSVFTLLVQYVLKSYFFFTLNENEYQNVDTHLDFTEVKIMESKYKVIYETKLILDKIYTIKVYGK